MREKLKKMFGTVYGGFIIMFLVLFLFSITFMWGAAVGMRIEKNKISHQLAVDCEVYPYNPPKYFDDGSEMVSTTIFLRDVRAEYDDGVLTRIWP